ncbi:MAG: SixA phosphatase family protein [Desulforhopalus sp.]
MEKKAAVQKIYLIRHAKSSWKNPGLDDYDRPLSKRGKKNAPEMARRLAARGVCPERIVSSPAKRARSTAVSMAKGTGYDKKNIRYEKNLYMGSLSYHLHLIAGMLQEVDVLFLVGHNYVITELAEHLTGSALGNVPTCGVVAVEYRRDIDFTMEAGHGKLLFFDFPKKGPDDAVQK